MNIIGIIQVRMGSSRLPNKALEDLSGISAIERMIKRVKLSKKISKLYIATGVSEQNSILVNKIKKIKGVHIYRGDDNNVLERFYKIAILERADIIVRLTGDCPLIDPNIIDKVINLIISDNSDYSANIINRTYPDGLDVEAFTLKTLKHTYSMVKDKYSKEHVTTYMHGLSKNSKFKGKFKISSLENKVNFSDLRWTLDEEKDLEFLKIIFANIKNNASWQEIISFLLSEPLVIMRNKEVPINEGVTTKKNASKFYKSNQYFKRTNNKIPLASQTFSKSYMQWPKGAAPLFIDRGQGAKVIDIDGNHYIDYVLGLLPVSLGYCDYDVDMAVIKQVNKGSIFSMPSKLETELAEKLIEIIPSAEMVRYGKNGSDVTTAAIRLARAYTGKDLIAVSGYHGWHDWSIGQTTRDLGVPKAVKKLTKNFYFNDLESLNKLIRKFPNKFAAIIIEPAGLTPTNIPFLKGLKKICKQEKIVLIFDEIISGFRIDIGGAQKFYGVVPDLSCFGKSMANGYPLSALVGKRKIMQLMEEIFFSTTFGGEAISIAASIATINKMQKLDTIKKVKQHGKKLINSVKKIILNNNMEDYINISNIDWWPQLILNSPLQDKNLFTSLVRQEFLKNGLILASTFNLCYEHCNNKVFESTLSKIDKSLVSVKAFIDSKNPEKHLEGNIIQQTFKVR